MTTTRANIAHLLSLPAFMVLLLMMGTAAYGDVVIDMPAPRTKAPDTLQQVFTASHHEEDGVIPKVPEKDSYGVTDGPGRLAFARYSRGRYYPQNPYYPQRSRVASAYSYYGYPYYMPYGYYGYGWPGFSFPFIFTHSGFFHH